MKTRIFTLLVLTITCVCISYAQNTSSEIKSVASEASTDTLSCAAARILAIEGNTSNVIVKGYVTSIAVEWNSTYKNISFWLADGQNGSNVFQAYRVTCAQESDAPSVGDLVWVKGKLQYYNNTTPEIGSGGSFGIIQKLGHVLSNGLYYNLNVSKKTAEVTYKSYSSTGGTYNTDWNISTANIPSSITSNRITYRVTTIGDYAFYKCKGLTSVTIPNSVTSIGERAFAGCTGLTSLTISDNVTRIGNYAFSMVNNIEYSGTATGTPWGAKCINGYVNGYLIYRNNSKTELLGCSSAVTGEIIIPNSVTSIGASAFYSCTSLTSVTIPNNVTSIGENAFYGCSSLPIVDNIRYADTYLIEAVDKSYSSYTINESTRWIGNDAFYNCTSLTSVTIPNSVTSIGNYAFNHCNRLTSVAIPDSVTSIGNGAFCGCTGLTSVTIGNSVKSIEWNAFSGCSGLTLVTIDANAICSKKYYSISSIHSIFGDQVEEYIIGNSVTGIGEYAFYGCSGLTSVTIGNSVTNIGQSAFTGCSGLNSVHISDIASWCAINFVNIDSNPLHYAHNLYENGNLITNLVIPNNVTIIRNCAFYDCSSLTSVTIPNSVTSIGNSAFYGCTGLTSVDISDIASWCAISFLNEQSNPLYLAHNLYENGNLIADLVIPSNVTRIGNYAFQNCTGLTSVTIPNSVTFIGQRAFNYCTGLTSVTFGNSVTSIGQSAFSGCSGLTSMVIPNSVTSIESYTFSNCASLTSVIIGNSVTNIENYAFRSCTDLSTVILEAETPPVLGAYSPFDNCTSLSKIIVPCGTLNTYQNQWTEYSHLFQYLYVIKVSVKEDVGGYVSAGTACDSMPELNATPDYGYHFVQWNDGNTDNPRTIVLTQDTTFIAEFAIAKSGTCGEKMALNWAFEDSTKTLTISGSGALTENYTFGLEAPTQMEHLVIGNEVTAIGDSAFYGKTTIAQVTIGGNVTAIGNYAFADIDNRQLTSIVMPAELSTIGDYAFSGNTYLESIDFNAKLLSIGAYAFKDCRRVSEMTCMAETTPDVGTNALSSINSYASLCVPASCVRKYQVDPNWGRFDLCELGATTSTGSVTTVTVEPSDNTALFTWPTENEAATYTLQITKDGEVFCTLVFNANGQLTGIAFAPSRTGAPHAPAATLSNGAMQFTVTGLNVANKYAYRLAVTDASNVELQSYSGEFATNGYEEEVNPGGETGTIRTDQLYQDPASNTQKLLRNGQILILRGDRTYTVTGQELR